jgi:penicillin-binding protein 1A
MAETNNFQGRNRDDRESAASEQRSQEGRSATLVAGRAFLEALSSDLVALARRSKGTLPRARRTKRALLAVLKAFAVVMVLGSLTLAGAMFWAVHDLPAEKPLGSDTPSFLLEAANGEVMGRVGPLRMPAAARADFPTDLVNAVISIEDRHFYSNWGFDPEGILRAFWRNINAGSIVEGGSTITQQLVKMLYLGHQRTYSHKLREALVAAWFDLQLSKDEILTRYLNNVYLGNGAYGMAAAAQLYFNKRLSDLTLAESAMLAGLIRAPSRDDPVTNPDRALARAAVVIDAMHDNGVINATIARDAKAHAAVLHLSHRASQARTWFADWIAKQAAVVPGSFSGHMRLRTTLMPDLQKLAEQAVNDSLADEGAKRHVSEAALVAMRPDGAVVAMVGGRNYDASQFNRAADAKRQPGSAFKLFVYLTALRKGFSAGDSIDASPIDIKGWEPENYDDRHYGRVTLAQAFAESINTAAVRLAQEVGLNDIIATARDLGLTSQLPAVPSLALGAVDVSLLELTAAYAAVDAGKAPIKPWGIAGFGVLGESGLQSMGPMIEPTQSLQPYQKPLLELLRDVVQHGTGRAAALDGFSAGKTGTSQGYRDAWFVGFNDDLVVGVWVGNDDDTPTDHVTGGSLPAAIWKRFMTGASPLVAQSQPSVLEALPSTVTPSAPAGSYPACDYQTCSRTYSSFRASDCTYQPYGGSERRVCTKNAPQTTSSLPLPQYSDSRPSPSSAQCNISACASFYNSFDPATCTYQPYDGSPRRVCER